MHLRDSEKAFTLVEVMTAVLILSIGMLGVAAMINMSLRSDNYNYYVGEAEQLANQKIEELRAKSADTTLAATDSGNWPSTSIQSNFCYSWTVTPDADTTRRISQVEVLVGWPAGANCKKDTVGKCDNRLRLIAFITQK